MALFTTEQANDSNIVRAESVLTDGVHSYWVFGIEDADGVYYDWKDVTLGATASDSDQRTGIHDFLIGNCEKKNPSPFITIESSDTVIGTTVGATGATA